MFKRLLTVGAAALTIAGGAVTVAPAASALYVPTFGPYASLRTCQYTQADLKKTGWTIVMACSYRNWERGSGYYIMAGQ